MFRQELVLLGWICSAVIYLVCFIWYYESPLLLSCAPIKLFYVPLFFHRVQKEDALQFRVSKVGEVNEIEKV